MTCVDTCQCSRPQTMCGNASTGLAILRILSCTVKHVTRVAPENGPIPRPRAPMQSIKTGYPLERIQIDILGPLPETNRENKYVAVVVDMYTKWPEAYALPNQEADTVAQAVMDNFVCRFGCPRGVLSDQGRNFESRLFGGLCDLIESVKQRTTPYHPQCDGDAERLIRTVTSVISKIAEEQEEWDQHLPKVLLALRASTHESTGFFPSMLMFGREMRLPIDAMRDARPSEEPPDYPPFVKKQREILKGVQDRMEKNLEASLRHQKDVYDARCKRKSKPYKVGDLVWLEKLLPCGRGARRDWACTLTVLNRTARDRHCIMSRRTETCLQFQMLESTLLRGPHSPRTQPRWRMLQLLATSLMHEYDVQRGAATPLPGWETSS